MIVCVHLPFFAPTIERPLGKNSADMPFVLVERGRRALSVVAASPLAYNAGIRRGMRLRFAQTLSPELEFISARPSYYRQMAYELGERLLAVTDRIEIETTLWQQTQRPRPQTSAETQGVLFYLDVGTLKPGNYEPLWHELGSCLAAPLSFESAWGIAEHKFTAFAAARTAALGTREAVKSGGDAAFLSSRSIALLPLEAETSRRMLRLGIRTLGIFASLPRGAVVSQFGMTARALHHYARGEDERQIRRFTPARDTTLYRVFDSAIDNHQTLLVALRELSDELGKRLEHDHLSVRSLHLTLMLENRGVSEAELTLRTRAADPAYIRRQVERLCSRLNLPCGVTAIELSCGSLVPRQAVQLDLFPQAENPAEKVNDLLEDMVTHYGESTFLKAQLTLGRSWFAEQQFELVSALA